MTQDEIDLNDYKIIKKENSKLYQVEEKSTKLKYAAKIVKRSNSSYKREELINIMRTFHTLKILECPTILKFIGYSYVDFDGQNYITIITDYANNKSFQDIFQDIIKKRIPKNYTNTTRQIILAGVAYGIKYLHQQGLMHAMLNLNNILLDDEFHPLISDIRSDMFFNKENSTYILNVMSNVLRAPYFSPEFIKEEAFSTKTDVYSFAIIMYEILTDSYAYPDLIEKRLNYANFYNKFMSGLRPTLKSKISKPFQKLIRRCWGPYPDERPSFDEIYEKIARDDDYLLDDVDIDEFRDYISQIETNKPSKLTKQAKSQLEKENHELKKKVTELEHEKEKSDADYESQLSMCKEVNKKQEKEIQRLQAELENLKKKQQSDRKQKKFKEIEILDEETLESYEKVEEVGSGGGGRVYKVYTKQYYALKEMTVKKNATKSLKKFIAEYEIISMLDHPNVIKSHGIFLSSSSRPPSILLEFCSTNLETVVENKTFSNEEIVCAIYQIVEGMKYVHFRQVIHRDLKPTNILIDSEGTIKICDFGISKLMTLTEQSTTRGAGTQKYMAPEIINEEEDYDEKVDVYSFGVVLFFMLSGGELPKIKLFDIPKGKKAEIPSDFTSFSKKLINDCWNLNPDDRPSFKMILKRLEKNHYNLLELSKTEIKNVEAFVEQHKTKIPKYE